MAPFSYTGIKVVHERMIKEALEHRRLSAPSEKRRTPRKNISAFLTRFTSASTPKPQTPFSECAGQIECKAS